MTYSNFIILIPAMLFALWAQWKVKSAYSRYSRLNASRGITGQQVARMILDENGLQHVNIEHISGEMTDHFDPRDNVVRLSDGVYSSSSIAAIGIAAHECGHAVQYGVNYAPMRMRSAIIPITNFGSTAAWPILLVGLFLNSYNLMMLGIIGYSLMAIFQIVTLPVEFNASGRALKIIESDHILEDDELRGARSMLTAAALTYVAALASTVSQILRFLMIANSRRR